MLALKLNRIGNSVGVVLPKEALSRLKLELGDTLYLTESPDGYRLTLHDPEFAEQMQVAEKIMRENRDVLSQLAK